jgi:hypothetical protein
MARLLSCHSLTWRWASPSRRLRGPIGIALTVAVVAGVGCGQRPETTDEQDGPAPPTSAQVRPATAEEIRAWLIAGSGPYFERGVDDGPRTFRPDGSYEQLGLGHTYGPYVVEPGRFCVLMPISPEVQFCESVHVGPGGR